MLQINNLHATVADKPILKGLTLSINAGEIHAIMGPNGAGKSTLTYTLGGRPGYEVTGGSVMFTPNPAHTEPVEGSGAAHGASTSSARADSGEIDLLALAPHERAAAGLFLALMGGIHFFALVEASRAPAERTPPPRERQPAK